MDRFGGLTIWRASWFGLSNRNADGTVTPHWPVRIASLILPLGAVALVLWTRTSLDRDAAGALVTASSLVAGALLGAFGLMAAWRERLTERADLFPTQDQPGRDMLDEAVAHILEAVRESVIVAVLAVVLLLMPSDWLLRRIAASAALCALAAHVGVLFAFLTTQLYAGYRARNNVRERLNGQDSLLKPTSRKRQTTTSV